MEKRYADLKSLLKHELLAEDDQDSSRLIDELRHVNTKGYFTKPEFVSMCRWKSPRPVHWYLANTVEQVESISREVFATAFERRRIELLTSLKGVNIPTASAILMLTDPKRYGVIDIRVWQLLYLYGVVLVKPGGQGFTFNNWYTYLIRLRYFARMFDTSARLVEWTLFRHHQNIQEGTLYKAVTHER
jgi:hypothetical protein